MRDNIIGAPLFCLSQVRNQNMYERYQHEKNALVYNKFLNRPCSWNWHTVHTSRIDTNWHVTIWVYAALIYGVAPR